MTQDKQRLHVVHEIVQTEEKIEELLNKDVRFSPATRGEELKASEYGQYILSLVKEKSE